MGQELRKTFVKTLTDLMADHPKLLVFEADLGGASGTTALLKEHADQFVQVGICEANMIGAAAGASLRGYVPFVHTFAPFTTRRALDQIYLEGAYAHNTINIYGSDPGVCVGANGGTHNTFEDVSTMRTIPNTVVVAPADHVQMDWVLREFADMEGVHYIRANRKANQQIYEEGSTFALGKGIVLEEGSDVLLLSYGSILQHALDAASELNEKGISTEVIDAFSLKPFDRELFLQEVRGKKLIVTFENHSIVGGLGSIAAEIMADEGLGIPLLRIGTVEQFGQVGPVDEQEKVYGLTKENLVAKTLEKWDAVQSRSGESK